MNRKIIPMIIVLALAIMMGALSVFGPGVAKADNPGGLTCGGSVSGVNGYFGSDGVWETTDQHNCNSGKTYSYEIQYDSPGSLSTWHDWSADHVVTSGSCATGCITTHGDGAAGCSRAGNIANYRIKAWWQDGSYFTAGYSASYACGGFNIH